MGNFLNWQKLCFNSDFLVKSRYLGIQSAEKMHYLRTQVICGDVHINHKHVLYSQFFSTHNMWPVTTSSTVSCKAVETNFYLGRHNQVIEVVGPLNWAMD